MEIKELFENWKRFCKSLATDDKSKYYTLFHENYTFNEIEEIFSTFPFKEELIRRYYAIVKPKEMTPNNVILKYVKNDMYEKLKFFMKHSDVELKEILKKNNYVFTSKEEIKHLLKEDIPQYWIIDIIGDHLFANRILSDQKTLALFEAFYGLVNNFQLVWYLGKPFYKTEYNPDYYFDIWKSGADYLIDRDVIYIWVENMN